MGGAIACGDRGGAGTAVAGASPRPRTGAAPGGDVRGGRLAGGNVGRGE